MKASSKFRKRYTKTLVGERIVYLISVGPIQHEKIDLKPRKNCKHSSNSCESWDCLLFQYYFKLVFTIYTICLYYFKLELDQVTPKGCCSLSIYHIITYTYNFIYKPYSYSLAYTFYIHILSRASSILIEEVLYCHMAIYPPVGNDTDMFSLFTMYCTLLFP